MEIQQSSQKQSVWADSQSEQKKAQQRPKAGQIYRTIVEYPMITSPWISTIPFIIPALYFVHFLDFYYSSVIRLYPDIDRKLLLSFSYLIKSDLAPIGYVINSLISIFILVAVFFNNINVQGWRYLIAWFGSRLFPVLRYMVELNLIVSAFFFINDTYSAIFFVISTLLNLVVNFFCQNYSLRKDYLCCKSVEFLMIFKIAYILFYVINCLGHRFIKEGSAKTIFLIFLCFHLLISAILVISYFSFGYNIYRHTTPRYLLVALITAKLSLSMSFVYDEINRSSLVYSETRDLIYTGVFWVLTTAVAFVTLRRMRANGTDPESALKKRIFFVFGKLEESSEDVQDDCETRGIIRWHWKTGCSNPRCYTNNTDKIYDSKKNRHCFLDKINQGKTSLIKFYIKCMYETELQKTNWEDTNLFLQYIEFYYMKLKNVYRVTHLLVDLESRFLNPFQKIRLERLKRVMILENIKLNGELYLGNLDIEFIIDSQNKFNEIREQVTQVLRNNLKFWEYASQNTIDLSEMTELMKPNMKKVDQINNNWKSIAKYFEIQKIWKFYFVCYNLYVKNQKLKSSFLEYFGLNVHEDQVFTSDSYHLEKTNQASKIFNSKMLFQPNTCCIHVNSHEQRPIIKRVNIFFEKMFKFTNAQIIESALQNLMTPSIRQGHHQKFLQWAGEGKSNNEATYQTKKIFPVDREGYIVPVFKFYKQFYCLDKELQYVAMMKKNAQDQCVLILNQNYEIEGMTYCLAKKLHFSHESYQTFCKINILAFFPSLIRYTKFQAQLRTANQQGGVNSTSFDDRKNLTTIDKKDSSVVTRKDYSKSNQKLVIPQNLEEIEQIYRKNKRKGNIEYGQGDIAPQKCIFNAIRQASSFIKSQQANATKDQKPTNKKNRQSFHKQSSFANEKKVFKFKTEIQVKQRVMGNSFYYEFYVRDIEQTTPGMIVGNKSSMSYLKQNSNNSNSVNNSRSRVPSNNEDEQAGFIQEDKQKSIAAEDFHKFFENSQNSQSISLGFSNNIFIKEDNNKPVNMISYVKSISISVRVFFVIFVALVGITFFLQNQNYSSFSTQCRKLSAVTSFQLKLYMLQNQYAIKKLNYAGYKSMATNLTQDLISINQNYYFKKSILDQRINPLEYYPAYPKAKIFAITNPPVYDQIDLINKMMEVTISMQYVDNLTKTRKQHLYLQAYSLPSVESLFLRTKENLSKVFEEIAQVTLIKNYIFYSSEAILLVLGFIVVLTSLIKISHSFVSMMEIFTQFSRSDLLKIQRYCDFILNLFTYLGHKSDCLAKQKQKMDWNLQNAKTVNVQGNEGDEDGNVNLNKKVKKVQVGKQLTNLKIKSIAFVIVFLFIYGVAAFGLNAYAGFSSDHLLRFEKQGFAIFKFYSVMDIQFHGLLEKQQGQIVYLQKYNKSDSLLKQMKQIRDRISITPASSKFEIRYNDILFDNFCEMYPQVLENNQTLIQQCQTVAQNTLQHGAQSFLYYLSSYINNHLTPETINKNGQGEFQLSEQKIVHLAKSVRYANIYLLYLLQTWQQQYISVTIMQQNYIMIICISLAIFMILTYFILIQILIVGNLQQKFNFFKKIYESYMPDFIVSKQKIIKAKLQVEGIINK